MNPSGQDRKYHARRINEVVWGRYGSAVIDRLVDGDYDGYNPALSGPVRGADGVRAVAETAQGAFRDIEVVLERAIDEGNRIAQRLPATGTHEGEYMGVEPTGSRIEIQGMTTSRLRDDKLVEDNEQWDVDGLFRQLGVTEPPIE